MADRAGRTGALALVVLAGLMPLAACGGGSSSKDVPPPPPSFGTTVDFAVKPSIANIPLTTPDGTKTSLAAYRGRPVMIADFMTLCADICPMISANTAALARTIAADGYGKKVALLEISIDSQRDTPARLRAYRKLFGPTLPDWTLLRASRSDTARLWKYFGLDMQRVKEERPPDIDWLTHKPLTYDIDHSDVLIFLDAAGHERLAVSASPDVQGKLPPPKLVRLLDRQGRQLLHHPDPVSSWTVGQGLSVFSWLLDHRLSASG